MHSMDMDSLKDTYIVSTIVTSSILAMLYVICLIRVWQGSRIPFIIKLCVLLFISNVGGGLMSLANSEVTNRY